MNGRRADLCLVNNDVGGAGVIWCRSRVECGQDATGIIILFEIESNRSLARRQGNLLSPRFAQQRFCPD